MDIFYSLQVFFQNTQGSFAVKGNSLEHIGLSNLVSYKFTCMQGFQNKPTGALADVTGSPPSTFLYCTTMHYTVIHLAFNHWQGNIKNKVIKYADICKFNCYRKNKNCK